MGMGTVILQPTIGHSPPQASMPLPPQQEAFYAASAAEPPAPPPSNARYEQQDDYYYPQRVPMVRRISHLFEFFRSKVDHLSIRQQPFSHLYGVIYTN